MELEDVRTFVTLATTGSFSRAAEELHLTQPAVTRRLQKLEAAVGATLIDRTHRPLRLTPAGVHTLEPCRQMLSAMADVLSSASVSGRPLCELRLGVAHALTEHALLGPVDQLRNHRPDVRLVLTTGWSHDLLNKVKVGRLDAALVLLDQREKLGAGLRGEVLATERLVPIAARSKAPQPRRLDEFRDTDWILNPEGCAARTALERTFHRSGVPMRVIVETYTYELQMALVAEARGFGYVPARLLARSKFREKLQTLQLDVPGRDLNVWVACGSISAPLSEAVTSLARTLAEQLVAPTARRTKRA